MRRFAQVDVFTDRPGLGNPVAVVIDAEGLSQETMARFANWTGLSETTFVLPATTPQADYQVRIFTQTGELPTAGHPTLGTCRALIDAGVIEDKGRWVQECAAGLIEIRGSQDGALSFAVPSFTVSDSPVPTAALSRTLGGPVPQELLLVNVGPRWLTGRVSLTELESVLIDQQAFLATMVPGLATGVTLYAVDEQRQVHVRTFFNGGGAVAEDPAGGSSNAAVGIHLRHTGRSRDVPEVYQARQGRHRGRDAHIRVSLGTELWVGGKAMTIVTGQIHV